MARHRFHDSLTLSGCAIQHGNSNVSAHAQTLPPNVKGRTKCTCLSTPPHTQTHTNTCMHTHARTHRRRRRNTFFLPEYRTLIRSSPMDDGDCISYGSLADSMEMRSEQKAELEKEGTSNLGRKEEGNGEGRRGRDKLYS